MDKNELIGTIFGGLLILLMILGSIILIVKETIWWINQPTEEEISIVEYPYELIDENYDCLIDYEKVENENCFLITKINKGYFNTKCSWIISEPPFLYCNDRYILRKRSDN